jgi:hypothetical protein
MPLSLLSTILFPRLGSSAFVAALQRTEVENHRIAATEL